MNPFYIALLVNVNLNHIYYPTNLGRQDFHLHQDVAIYIGFSRFGIKGIHIAIGSGYARGRVARGMGTNKLIRLQA